VQAAAVGNLFAQECSLIATAAIKFIVYQDSSRCNNHNHRRQHSMQPMTTHVRSDVALPSPVHTQLFGSITNADASMHDDNDSYILHNNSRNEAQRTVVGFMSEFIPHSGFQPVIQIQTIHNSSSNKT
jgi:hypothetical protein